MTASSFPAVLLVVKSGVDVFNRRKAARKSLDRGGDTDREALDPKLSLEP